MAGSDAAIDALGREKQDDCVFDLTGVDKAELATDFVSRRGKLPQAFKDRERIFIVAQPDLKLLVRFCAAYPEAIEGLAGPAHRRDAGRDDGAAGGGRPLFRPARA